MKTRPPSSIRSTLLAAFSMVIVLFAVILLVYVPIWQIRQIRSNSSESVKQLSASIVLGIDGEIAKMDSVSLNTLYSNLVKETFAVYTGYQRQGQFVGSGTSLVLLNNSKMLIDLLSAIIGSSRPVQQLYLYDLQTGMFSTGIDTGFYPISCLDSPWHDDVLRANGTKVFYGPHTDPRISRYVTTDASRMYLSLLRLYFDSFNRPAGIVEVEQYYDTVFRQAILASQEADSSVFIYDPSGRRVFPVLVPDNGFDGYLPLQRDANADGFLTVDNPVTHAREVVYYQKMPYSGFTSAIVQQESAIMAPVRSFLFLFSLAALLLLVIAALLALFATRRIAGPINEMYSFVRRADADFLTEPFPGSISSGGTIETSALWDALRRMQRKLKESMDRLLLSQQHEMQSRILALESQMNPHFLYNSLSTVAAMADAGMTAQVREMCISISDILRYISSNKEQMVTLEDELENTHKYLTCLALRYGDQLSFEFDVPDDMLEVKIPKLCVQLLVENAVKFAATISPPWRIRIVALGHQDRWTVSVLDNGPGFSAETLKELDKKIAEVDHTGLLPNLELNGMGLMNVYIRLKLRYKDHTIFNLCNRDGGGATAMIGGDIDA